MALLSGKMERKFGWFWFLSGEESHLIHEKCGKWMYFFTDQYLAIALCQKAIDEHVCYECKCSDLEFSKAEKGVLCFYLNGDDIENHKRVLRFMIDNNLIERTQTGRYYNISFKFDSQTIAGEYGEDFKSKIKLDNFLNLQTGEWIDSNTEHKTANEKKKAGVPKKDNKPKRDNKVSPYKSLNYSQQIIDDYCVLDVETTGRSASVDEIIEIAMLRVRNNEIVESYTQLIRPFGGIPSFITQLTGISNTMVEEMPYIWDIENEVLSFLGDDVILGHNTSFDLRFLNTAFEMSLENEYMDTYQFSRKVFPNLNSHRLTYLSRHFNLTNSEHRALSDCIATKELYDLIKKTMKESNIRIEDLWRYKRKNSEKRRSNALEAYDKYMGQEKIQRDGRLAKITAYRKYTDIDVTLDDGSVIEHTTIEKWRLGRAVGCANTRKRALTLRERYLGRNCLFGEDKPCDDSCEYYETCTRALR